jgi:hypothetical protein
MTLSVRSLVATLLFPSILLLFSCSTPSLVEIARRRQATADGEQRSNARDDVRVRYDITDWDVLNYTDEVKRKLANRANIHAGLRYGSATGQVTLAALAGAALTAGWGVATASGLGLGASYLFGLSHVFNSRSQSQAYETAFTAIEKAESNYYLHQLGYSVSRNSEGQYQLSRAVNRDPQTYSRDGTDIPQKDRLTIDGETLYYRVTKTLKVLDDALEQKIPSLEDLRDSMSDSTGVPPSSVPPPTSSTHLGATNPHAAGPVQTPPGTSAETAGSTTSEAEDPGKLLQQFGWPGGTKNDQNIAQLRRWMDDNGLKDIDVAELIHSAQFAAQRQTAITSLRLSNRSTPDAWGIKLRNFCWPSGKENSDNKDRLRQWMKSNSLSDVDLVSFIFGQEYVSQRRDAVGYLHL